jgi:hypothetical protein
MAAWNSEGADRLVELVPVLAAQGDCEGARMLLERASAIYARGPGGDHAVPRAGKPLGTCGAVGR